MTIEQHHIAYFFLAVRVILAITVIVVLIKFGIDENSRMERCKQRHLTYIDGQCISIPLAGDK